MTPVHVILIVAVISTGLFTGLMMTILAFFQRILKDLTAREFTLVMQRFLGVVRTHRSTTGSWPRLCWRRSRRWSYCAEARLSSSC
jgi:hypothetical protein